ncbi:MAG: hypothetical protein Q9191_008387 [Dirinaria sp. TL-2023a]
MTDFEDSPRPAKRQRTTDDAPVSLSTRALRAVKGAVFGQSYDAQANGIHDGEEDELAHPGEVNEPSTPKKDEGGSIWSKPLSTFERWKLSRQKNHAQFGRKGASSPVVPGRAASPTPTKTPTKRKRRKSVEENEVETTVKVGMKSGADVGKDFGSNKKRVKGVRNTELAANGERESTADGPDPIQNGAKDVTPEVTRKKTPSTKRLATRSTMDSGDVVREGLGIGKTVYANGTTPEPETPRKKGRTNRHTKNDPKPRNDSANNDLEQLPRNPGPIAIQ